MTGMRVLKWSAFFGIALVGALAVPGSSEVRAGGGCRGVPLTEASGTAVRMLDSCFEPSILRVDPGQTVTWTNTSKQPHNVAGQNTAWGSYEELQLGNTVSHVFENPGTYAYYCFVHNGMIGVVVVGDGVGAPEGRVSQPEFGSGSSAAVVSHRPAASGLSAPEPAAAPAVEVASSDGSASPLTVAAVLGLSLAAGAGTLAFARRR